MNAEGWDERLEVEIVLFHPLFLIY